MSKPEFILALTSSYVESQVGVGFTSVEQAKDMSLNLDFNAVFAQRERLDNKVNADHKGDRNYKQVIPYSIIPAVKGHVGSDTPLYCYKRSGGGESRLEGNVSIGFGGHVDLVDIWCDGPSLVNVLKTIHCAGIRELEEELKILHPYEEEFSRFTGHVVQDLGYIYDDSNDVGKLHVGFVNVVEPSHFNVHAKEAELVMLEPMTARELLSSGRNLENWTRLVCEWLCRAD